MRKPAFLILFLLLAGTAFAQPGVLTKELLRQYTPEWKGERFADGRPKVPESILERMKKVTLEEAWATVTAAGYRPAVRRRLVVDPSGKSARRTSADLAMAARPARYPKSHRGSRAKPTHESAGPTPGPWTCCSRATSTSATISA